MGKALTRRRIESRRGKRVGSCTIQVQRDRAASLTRVFVPGNVITGPACYQQVKIAIQIQVKRANVISFLILTNEVRPELAPSFSYHITTLSPKARCCIEPPSASMSTTAKQCACRLASISRHRQSGASNQRRLCRDHAKQRNPFCRRH